MKRGVTLVELLAAMAISGLVIVLASRLFVTSNREFVNRFQESDQLAELYRIKHSVQALLDNSILSCGDGRVVVRDSSGAKDVGATIRARFTEVDSVVLRCFSEGELGDQLVEVIGSSEAQLIEYRFTVGRNSKRYGFVGSCLR